LDVKGPNLIKGVQLEGLRKLGDPQDFARRYYEAGIDELIYMDVVASLYGRNNLIEVVRHTAENVFIPITVGGGIRSVDDARMLLRSGADKIAVNTAAITNPDLIEELASAFGAQCVVLSVEAIRQADGRWEAHTDNGREKTGRDVVEWVQEAVGRGAGEILLTSVDREGTQSGCDLDLANSVSGAVNIPVILSGGVGGPNHFTEAVIDGGVDAVAVAHVLH
ncbi:MAG: imidazole glycerol phosphate synthase cyclase subunit, partial [Planctomycetaceae bacterium]